MKLLVFAHTPPPHHGQSYMVKLMLEGFGGDHRKRHSTSPESGDSTARDYGIECYHVNARLSRDLEDIGEIRPQKLFLLFGYCLQAIWCRFRYGVTVFYYIPSPGKRAALVRDWMVMFLCRPFFKKLILHWHAAGMSKWLETATQPRTRSVTYRLMKWADLSIVLSRYGKADGRKFLHSNIEVVANGIPDPCPDFETAVLPRRLARYATRAQISTRRPINSAHLENTGGDPHIFKVLYLAHCFREKGLFDTVDAVSLANQELITSGSEMRIQLIVAGNFVSNPERAEFETRIAAADFQSTQRAPGSPAVAEGRRAMPPMTLVVDYRGFVSGKQKQDLFREADCFCFPTYYRAESFGLVLAEAMAFGLPAVTTRWRAIPEILPEGHPGIVPVRAPDEIARALLQSMRDDAFANYRRHFSENFTLEQHLSRLAAAIRSVEHRQEPAAATGAPATLAESNLSSP